MAGRDGAKRCVWVLEDDPTDRRDCARSLTTRGFEVEAFTTPSDAQRRLATDRSPDVLLIEEVVCGMQGTEWLREHRRFFISTQVYVLTGHADSNVSVRALRLGAQIVLKPITQEFYAFLADTFVTAVREAETLDGAQRRRFREVSGRAGLSGQQIEILELAVVGYRPKEIASRLNVSTRSIESQIQRLFDKTGIHDMREIVRLILIGTVGPGGDNAR